MVKILAAVIVAAIALPGAALAETPAKATEPAATGAPLQGANSFTETQARKRISEAAYEDIGTLKKDDQGVWRTVATKDGAAVSVSVDFKGNVTTSTEKVIP